MRRGTTRGTGMLAVAAGAVLVLAGCTATAEPEAEPTGAAVEQSIAPTATATSAPTATPTASVAPESIKPERPEAMSSADSAGAEALAVYYMTLFPYVNATGDLADWDDLRHPECIFCASVATTVGDRVAAGHRTEGGLVLASNVRSSVVEPDRWWHVTFDLQEEPSRTVDGAGATTEEFPDTKRYVVDAAIVYDAGVWSVRAVSHTRVD